MRVLLVDDSEDNLLILGRFLSTGGHEVVKASSGLKAIAAVEDDQIDVVLMDIMMEGLDGFQTLERIREIEAERSMYPHPVLALTARVFPDDVIRFEEAGFDGHISKPITRAQLLDAVNAFEGPERSYTPPVALDINEAIGELLPDFLRRRRKDVEKIRAAIEQRDMTVVQEIGHRLTGSGATYGFGELTALGRRFEMAAAAGNVEMIDATCRELVAAIEAIEARRR